MSTLLTAKVERLAGLTPKEARVLAALCEGKTDRAIANQLAMSIKTVECHCGHIYDKLQVRADSINARCAAIATAVARGLVVLSTRALCIWLMVSAAGLDEARMERGGQVRVPRVQIARVKIRNNEGLL